VNPEKPKHIPSYAEACLTALASQGFGAMLSLGGAFGLAYYLDYRQTHDVGAWWAPSAGEEKRRSVVALLEQTLARFGSVRTRSWGDVTSIDLKIEDKAVFSFQIAHRSAQLEEPKPAPWPPGMLLALVERGAPRDFRDIWTLCQAGLAKPALCWKLWKQRCELTGDDAAPARARLGVLTHLQRIELHRPLQVIADEGERGKAERLRAWFRGEFLDGIVD
jgi:hypothetical protein